MNASHDPLATDAAGTLARLLDRSDHVLVTAGAGLSAAAGYDYTDTYRFAELFPAHHRLGFRARYELIGRRLDPPLHWGFWAVHVNEIRFGAEPNSTYQRLRAVIGERDHFVLTTNVDALFARNGFEHERLYTPQGDYGLLQCETPCTRTVWASRPAIEELITHHDPASGQITDLTAIPRCPDCGGEVFLNVRKGPEFIGDHYLAGAERLRRWLNELPEEHRLLVLDVGTGFNTPIVARTPAEHVAARRPNTTLVRLNLHHPQVPGELAGRAWSYPVDIEAVLSILSCTVPS